MCGTGDLQACEVMYAYEMARSGMSGNSQVSGGSPADSIPRDRTISASPDNEAAHHAEIVDRRTLSSQHTPRRRGCRTTHSKSEPFQQRVELRGGFVELY